MELRILTYTGLIYEELIRWGGVQPGNKLPPLLPVAVYNVAGRCGCRPTHAGLHQALYSWVADATEAWQIPTRTWRG